MKKPQKHHVVIPEDLYQDAKQLAKDKQTTMTSIIRQGIKILIEVSQRKNAKLILQEEGEIDTEIILL